jgi:pimeloyl-ACP methyl ester carboxylesterase
MRIRVADIQVYFTASTRRSWEAWDGPVILGLHGGPGLDGSQLRYFLSPAEEWATVVVPDQRGHGRTDRSSAEKWTLAQWADDVRRFIDALGLEHVILVGTSFGGLVVQRFLATHPGVVRGGVIVGASPRRATAEEILDRYRDLGGEEAARVMERSLTDHSKEAQKEWARVCGPLSRVRPPDKALMRIQRERITSLEVNEHFMSTFADLDLRADLSAVRDPMMVLAGEKDPLTPPHVAAEIQEHADGSNVRFHVVEGASHQVLWDQPTRSDELLRHFARSLGLHMPKADGPS